MHIFFFFQAEDGIRDGHVTGVQTCALPISRATSTSTTRTRRRKSAPSSSPANPSAASEPPKTSPRSSATSVPTKPSSSTEQSSPSTAAGPQPDSPIPLLHEIQRNGSHTLERNSDYQRPRHRSAFPHIPRTHRLRRSQ